MFTQKLHLNTKKTDRYTDKLIVYDTISCFMLNNKFVTSDINAHKNTLLF